MKDNMKNFKKHYKTNRNYTTTIKHALEGAVTFLATCDQKDGSVRSILSEGVDRFEKSYLYKSKNYRNKVKREKMINGLGKGAAFTIAILKTLSESEINSNTDNDDHVA